MRVSRFALGVRQRRERSVCLSQEFFVMGCRALQLMSVSHSMRGMVIVAAFSVSAAITEARAKPPLHDHATLNIGFVCQWQQRCMAQQSRAMTRALSYVQKQRPPDWRVHLCNRNASRSRSRVDWVGFDNCIRNAALRPTPERPLKKRSRRVA
jgi:hypothetical protein